MIPIRPVQREAKRLPIAWAPCGAFSTPLIERQARGLPKLESRARSCDTDAAAWRRAAVILPIIDNRTP